MNFKERYKYDPKNDLLGKGGFSTVFLGTDTLLDRKVAIKFFSSSHDEKYSVISEIKKVIKLEHPNIARYFDAQILETPNVHGGVDKVEVGVMELLDGGELKDFLSNHNGDNELRDKLLTDVLKGLSYLHKRNIIHRDLKPQNILIKTADEGPVAKIMDFGISKSSGSNTSSSALLGSIEYMAPEQFNPAKYGVDGKIDTNVDLWSYGVMLYELLRESSLFGARTTGHTTEQVMSNILQKNIEEDLMNVEQPWRGIIERCLVKDAAQRAQNADELLELYANPQESKASDQQPTPAKEQTPQEAEKEVPPAQNPTTIETQVLEKPGVRKEPTVKSAEERANETQVPPKIEKVQQESVLKSLDQNEQKSSADQNNDSSSVHFKKNSVNKKGVKAHLKHPFGWLLLPTTATILGFLCTLYVVRWSDIADSWLVTHRISLVWYFSTLVCSVIGIVWAALRIGKMSVMEGFVWAFLILCVLCAQTFFGIALGFFDGLYQFAVEL